MITLKRKIRGHTFGFQVLAILCSTNFSTHTFTIIWYDIASQFLSNVWRVYVNIVKWYITIKSVFKNCFFFFLNFPHVQTKSKRSSTKSSLLCIGRKCPWNRFDKECTLITAMDTCLCEQHFDDHYIYISLALLNHTSF